MVTLERIKNCYGTGVTSVTNVTSVTIVTMGASGHPHVWAYLLLSWVLVLTTIIMGG